MPRTAGEVKRVYLVSKAGRRSFAAHLFDRRQDGSGFLSIRPRGSSSICVKLSAGEIDELLKGNVIRKENEALTTAWSIRRLG